MNEHCGNIYTYNTFLAHALQTAHTKCDNIYGIVGNTGTIYLYIQCTMYM